MGPRNKSANTMQGPINHKEKNKKGAVAIIKSLCQYVVLEYTDQYLNNI